MKDEDKDTKKVLKKPKALDKTSLKKRIEFIVTYEIEGSKSKKHKVHAYSREGLRK